MRVHYNMLAIAIAWLDNEHVSFTEYLNCCHVSCQAWLEDKNVPIIETAECCAQLHRMDYTRMVYKHLLPWAWVIIRLALGL